MVATTVTQTVTSTVTPVPAPMRAQMQTWYSGIREHLAQLADGGHALSEAARNHDMIGIGAGCRQVHDAAAEMQKHVPPPDPELASPLQTAVSDYDAGSHFCIAGSQDYDLNELQQSIQMLQSANDHMDSAVTILQRDLGSTWQPATPSPSHAPA
ncbi:hypothetical protein [Mycobacterium sp. E735]|uniref:hypothetical protein n=1 Tax=Mycobacterium sp. E735 TaxID=1834148 RepID=UPI0012E9DA6A|nr:hypothetical protein [Mycobacterium sp. E735]